MSYLTHSMKIELLRIAVGRSLSGREVTTNWRETVQLAYRKAYQKGLTYEELDNLQLDAVEWLFEHGHLLEGLVSEVEEGYGTLDREYISDYIKKNETES